MQFFQFSIQNHDFLIVGDAQGITQLMIDNGTRPIEIDAEWQRDETPFLEAIKQLEEYFAGKRQAFELTLKPQGSAFHHLVWQKLQEIPYGQLVTYKDIAVKVGNAKASRAVGMANMRNPIPIIIPCHRVIGSNGKLVGYAFGVKLKKELIAMETHNSFFQS